MFIHNEREGVYREDWIQAVLDAMPGWRWNQDLACVLLWGA